MNILIILDHFPASSKRHRKAGLFPLVIKMHVDLGYHVTVAVKNGNNTLIARELDNIGANYIPRKHNLNPAYLWQSLKNAPDKTWWKFIWKTRRFHSSVQNHFRKKAKPDCIVALMGVEQSGMLAYLTSHSLSTKFIIWEHKTHYARGSLDETRKNICRTVINSSDKVLAVSAPLLKNMESALAITINHGEVLNNPVSDTSFDHTYTPVSKIDNFKQGRFTYGGWTNWRKIKRPELLLKAFEKVHAANPDTCLIMIGPVDKELVDQYTAKPISNAILFTGSVPREEIDNYIFYIDCVVLPSDFETFGLPVIEAMSHGKPAIATECGGPEDILTSDKLGILIPRNDLTSLIEAMVKINKEYSRYDANGLKSHCMKNYSASATADRWKEVYKSLPL